MGKEKYVEMKGTVTQALPNATFKVELRLKPQVRAVRNCYCVQQYTLRVTLPVVACDTACGL